MSDKAALRGRWGATNHDFDFRKYNTFAEQIHKEQEAQFKAARQQAGLQKADGANAHGHRYTTGNYHTSSGDAKEVDWGKPPARTRPLPISGVPQPRFHNRGGDGTRRHWGSEPEPQTSAEIGGWYGKRAIYADLDYDGMDDAAEASGDGGAGIAAIRTAAKGPTLDASASQDARDDALLRAINGRRDKFGAEIYTVVNLENAGYML
jgi:hypothetical protein